jgi:alginate export protein
MDATVHCADVERARVKNVCVVVTRYAVTAWLGLFSPALVSAQTSGAARETPERPAYQDRRFDEDWSKLKDVDLSGPGHEWDRPKFFPLNEGETVWVTFAGQVRGRSEYYNQFQFGDSKPEQSAGYSLSRVRLSADLHVSKYFRIFAEGKGSQSTDRDLTGGSAANVDNVDLQNLFADVVVPLGGPATVAVRGGRQELLFGAQRLVGPSDWTNVRRTFQGGSAIIHAGGWSVTPMWNELVMFKQHGLSEATADHKLYGAYASGEATGTVKADLYWLGVDNASAKFNQTSGHEKRQTIGGRLWRRAPSPHQASTHEHLPGLDFDLEAAGQFGTLGGEDIRAWMISANGGYTFESRLSPRPFVTFDYASGDDTPGGRVGTFNQLYPTNHTYLGAMDYVGRQNIISPSGGVSVRPIQRLSVVATQFLFWRANVHDALYGNSGGVFRSGIGTTARYVGTESDLIATYQFDPRVLGYVSYNHFFTGDFIQKTGPSRGSDYYYGALQFTF